jgi:hypothetical protein
VDALDAICQLSFELLVGNKLDERRRKFFILGSKCPGKSADWI